MNDKEYLHLAIEQAQVSVEQGGFPAGAIVVLDNKIISRGVSLGGILHDPTSHAETASIRAACLLKETTDLSGATLYAAMQPCNMCFSVANWAGVSRIIFGCKKTEEMARKNYYEGMNDIEEMNKKNNRQLELVYIPDFEAEVLALTRRWEDKN